MKHTARGFILSMVAIACLSNLAFASENSGGSGVNSSENSASSSKNSANSTQPKSISLDTITVTATKTPIKVEEVPVNVDILTNEDLEVKANSDNLYDALKMTPGTFSSSSSMGWGDIRVRGFTPAILLNGRDSRHFATTYAFDSNLVDMGAVERVEVLKGPQSTMHGGRAISGAINVIMKKGDKDNPFLDIKTGFGSANTALGGITTGGGIDNFSYILSLHADKKSKFKTKNGVIPHNKSNRQNFYARFDYDFNDKHSLTFDYTYNKSKHITGGKGQYHPSADNYDHKIWDANPAFYTSANLSYNGEFNDIFSLYVTSGIGENNFDYTYGYNGFNNTNLNDYLSRQNRVSMKNKFFQNEIRGTLNLLPEERLRAIVGVQHKSTKLDWPAIVENKPFYHNKDKETYYAPYTQVEYRPMPQILAIAGVRYDKYTYDKSSDKSSLSPRLSLSYMPFAGSEYDYTTLWVGYSEAFNPPTAVQILGIGSMIAPNPNIKPEKAKGYEAGLKQRLGVWGNFEFSYFDTNYDNLISSANRDGKHWRFYNINKAKVKGYEAKLEAYVNDYIMLYASYTDMKRTDENNKARLLGQPDKILQYGISVFDLYGFSADLSALRLSGYKNSSSYAKNLGEYHPSNGTTLVNLKALYKFEATSDLIIEPYLAVNNLTNKTYYEGLPPALIEERNYQGGVNFRLKF